MLSFESTYGINPNSPSSVGAAITTAAIDALGMGTYRYRGPAVRAPQGLTFPDRASAIHALSLVRIFNPQAEHEELIVSLSDDANLRGRVKRFAEQVFQFEGERTVVKRLEEEALRDAIRVASVLNTSRQLTQSEERIHA